MDARGFLIGLFFAAVSALLCGVIAERKWRSPLGWALFGFLLPLVALVLLLILPSRRARSADD
jgi:hypothetical protein